MLSRYFTWVGVRVQALPDDAAAMAALPLIDLPGRAIAWRNGAPVSTADFLADVAAVAAALPAQRHALNLCDDRYLFLVGLCAAAVRGQTSLLPHSRAPDVVVDTLARHADSYSLIDHAQAPLPPRMHRLQLPAERTHGDIDVPLIDSAHPIAIGFTSGSTGTPSANEKRWGSFVASTANNAAVLLAHCPPLAPGAAASIVATVPPQHMYGMEMSVLLPLLGPFAVHAGRPFFPAEVAAALAEMPAPRILVTTPVHLRALLAAGQALPPLAAIVSATAPLPVELAQQAEQVCGAPVQELFGSTETCVIAHRRTAVNDAWELYPEVSLQPQPDGTRVDAPWFARPVVLQDLVELLPQRRFALRGRSADLLEIAGKRASLAELSARLLAMPGVVDAVVFQSDNPDAAGVRRIIALVVAPGCSEAALIAGLRRSVDPVFLPRPLKLVDALPRNATGKLPRAELLGLLEGV
jgi:acyl-coenzyme A synthetase/AMP-(fatty) acid ligase